MPSSPFIKKLFSSSGRAGFSMFEVVIAMGIAVIIVVSVGKFSNSISNIGVVISNSLQADQDLALAFRTLTTDVRSMGPSSNGAYPIEAASTSSLTFYSDIDQDGIFERIRYYVTTSTFEKGVIEPAGNPLVYATSSEIKSIVTPNIRVKSDLFQYFDTTYNGSSTALSSPITVSAIRVIKVTLTADVSTSTAPRPVTLTTTVTIRNLRSN